MATLQVLIVVWSLCTGLFLVLILYRSHLTRHEVDVVFLNENAGDTRETEHDDIVRRVDKIDPFLKTAAGAAALMTIAVIGVYVAQILPTVRF